MVVESADNRPQVAEITRAVPEYLPTGLVWSGASPNNSFAIWGDGSNKAYIFKFFNQGNERQLAGWSSWTLPADIKMWDFDNDTSYIVAKDEFNNHTLLEMEMLDDPETAPVSTAFGTKFLPRLDYLQEKSEFVQYNNTTKRYFPDGAYPGNGSKPVLMITSGSSEGSFVRGEAKQDDNCLLYTSPSPRDPE